MIIYDKLMRCNSGAFDCLSTPATCLSNTSKQCGLARVVAGAVFYIYIHICIKLLYPFTQVERYADLSLFNKSRQSIEKIAI